MFCLVGFYNLTLLADKMRVQYNKLIQYNQRWSVLMIKRMLCTVMCAVLLPSGFDYYGGQHIGVTNEAMAEAGIQTEDDITTSIPESHVKVMVNRFGYLPDSEKKVIFVGDKLGETFRVVNADTYEVVYTGQIENKGQNVSQGNFSTLTTEGTYYVETDIIGRSYSFIIGKDAYNELFGYMAKGENITYEKTPESISNVCFGMHAMMLALECHGTLFENVSEQGKEQNGVVVQLLRLADWLSAQQDEKTGSICEDYDATAAFCGIMSMCKDVFGKYDTDVAKQYTVAAKNAWKWLSKQNVKNKEQEHARFYAAVQQLSIENGNEYKKMVADYLNKRKDKLTEDRFIFYGAMAYLGIKKGTDRELCTDLMQEFVQDTESISQSVKKEPFLVYSDDITENLHKILLICFSNYITPSNEYRVVIENTLHYMTGRNADGISYIDAEDGWQDVKVTKGHNLEWNGILLFCLSDILDDTKNQ